MILLVDGAERARYPSEMSQMFKLRKKVFHDRLGWDVRIEDGMEIDAFDGLDPLYVLSIAPDTGRVTASLRLLPTTGPNMLCDVFCELLADGLVVRSATVWESSRFCVDHEAFQDRSANRVAMAASELMCAVGEIGLSSGLTHIVTVTDLLLERIFRRMECPAERLGRPRRIGKVDAVAVHWEISSALLARMKSAAGIRMPLTAHGRDLAAARV
jgi:acyl homoserine lactone synthase